jgi:LCP family protein required for cell wall assembly
VLRSALTTVAAAGLAGALGRNGVSAADLARPVDGRPVVYLVVGSDDRAALPPDSGGGSVAGRRADMLALLALPPRGGPVHLVSLPRDLRVRVPGHGEQKLGGVYEYGSRTLLATVEVDFAGLARLVDVLGGITVDSPHPARDKVTGLALPAGRSRLDGRSALAYVRSRTYEERRDGRWEYVDPNDLGRIQRQHRFLAAMLSAAKDPAVLRRVAAEVGRHVTVDGAFTSSDARRWLRMLTGAGAGLSASILPTRPRTDPEEAGSPFPPAHAGSSLQLVRREPDAASALSAFAGSRG